VTSRALAPCFAGRGPGTRRGRAVDADRLVAPRPYYVRPGDLSWSAGCSRIEVSDRNAARTARLRDDGRGHRRRLSRPCERTCWPLWSSGHSRPGSAGSSRSTPREVPRRRTTAQLTDDPAANSRTRCGSCIDIAVRHRTPDSEIARRADSDQRVVVTKDRDFRDSHLLNGTPRSLLIVTTGNIGEPQPARPVRTSHRCHRGVPDRFPTRRTLARSSCRSRLEQHQAVTNSPRTQRDPTPLSTCEPCFRRGGLNDEHCCVPVPCIQQSHVRWLTGSNGACCASPRRRERQGSTGLVEYGCLESFQALGDPRWRVVVGVMLLDSSSHESGWLDVLCQDAPRDGSERPRPVTRRR